MQIKYTGELLEKRASIKTGHRILIFYGFSVGELIDNYPYNEVLKYVPNSYCDGYTIYLPDNFNNNECSIGGLKKHFSYLSKRGFVHENLKEIGYVNDEEKKLTKIYTRKQLRDEE